MSTPRRTRRTAGDFLYRAIADRIRTDLQAGRLAPGARLPSLDALARTHRANRLTVLRALNSLKQAGLLYSVPAQGTYVSDHAPPAKAGRSRRGGLTVGVLSRIVYPGRIGPYHADLLAGLQEGLAGRGTLALLPSPEHADGRSAARPQLRDAVDAVVYIGPFDEDELRPLIENGPPAVLVDYAPRRLAVDAIAVDNRGGGALALEHLVSLGHRTIAVITGPENQPSVIERMEGVREVTERVGRESLHLHVVPGAFTRESGHAAMQRVLRDLPGVTAVFCMNDEMAAGALQAVHAAGTRRVPDTLSVIGFDNTEYALAAHPPLTTIHLDRQSLGRLAAQRLLERMAHPDAPPVSSRLQTRLVERESTAPPARRPARR